mmetsp:Transcript_13562/g.23815  ORF Transcript_13562/g.23815 Transcript_13562/m.23815 type:complete len:249 (+) Transcript_13562:137-883(+)
MMALGMTQALCLGRTICSPILLVAWRRTILLAREGGSGHSPPNASSSPQGAGDVGSSGLNLLNASNSLALGQGAGSSGLNPLSVSSSPQMVAGVSCRKADKLAGANQREPVVGLLGSSSLQAMTILKVLGGVAVARMARAARVVDSQAGVAGAAISQAGAEDVHSPSGESLPVVDHDVFMYVFTYFGVHRPCFYFGLLLTVSQQLIWLITWILDNMPDIFKSMWRAVIVNWLPSETWPVTNRSWPSVG